MIRIGVKLCYDLVVLTDCYWLTTDLLTFVAVGDDDWYLSNMYAICWLSYLNWYPRWRACIFSNWLRSFIWSMWLNSVICCTVNVYYVDFVYTMQLLYNTPSACKYCYLDYAFIYELLFYWSRIKHKCSNKSLKLSRVLLLLLLFIDEAASLLLLFVCIWLVCWLWYYQNATECPFLTLIG